jgi:uncharacterized protein YxjI
MSQYCPKCGTQLIIGGKFCPRCGENVEQQTMQPIFTPQSATPTSAPPIMNAPIKTQQYGTSGLWYQNFYRIRKKTITIGNKYWLEDQSGAVLGFCKQKLFKLKEDIRIYTDENESQELFRIKQEQIMDAWGNFAVIDSATNNKLGFVKRNIISAFVKDTWELYNTSNQMVGKIEETSTGSALARKYLPGGALIPEKMRLEMNGQILADINQEFKIIGDIWTMNCQMVPSNFDRRVLLACILLMGMIERRHK